MIAFLLACAGGRTGAAPEPWAGPAVRDRMHQHFAHATDAVYGVVLGDLERARAEAAALRDLGPIEGMPEAWGLPLDAVRAAAARAAESPDLDALAGDVVAIGRACAGCHASVGAPAIAADEALRGAGAHHEWAAYALWLGVALPSDALWARGVAGLRDGRPAEHAEAFDAVATVAAAALDPDARAGALADLLRSCSECHAAAGVALPR